MGFCTNEYNFIGSTFNQTLLYCIDPALNDKTTFFPCNRTQLNNGECRNQDDCNYLRCLTFGDFCEARNNGQFLNREIEVWCNDQNNLNSIQPDLLPSQSILVDSIQGGCLQPCCDCMN